MMYSINDGSAYCQAEANSGTIESETREICDKTLQITENIVAMCEESIKIGMETNDSVDVQGEQIKKIHTGIENMDENMNDAHTHLTGIES